MTWPTANITTANVDNGLDNPALARVQIKQAIDNINSVASEFGNVGITSSTDLHLLQYNSTAGQWQNRFPKLHRYEERLYTHSTTQGNVTIDYSNGNVQRIQATGNIAFSYANFPEVGTLTVIIDHNGATRSATWPASSRFQSNISSLSVGTAPIDVAVISTYDSGTTYLVSLARGFVAS